MRLKDLFRANTKEVCVVTHENDYLNIRQDDSGAMYACWTSDFNEATVMQEHLARALANAARTWLRGTNPQGVRVEPCTLPIPKLDWYVQIDDDDLGDCWVHVSDAVDYAVKDVRHGRPTGYACAGGLAVWEDVQ